jgi:hypothetical protein
MRYVLPALPVIAGPAAIGRAGARRRGYPSAEGRGAARRSGKTRPAVAAPHSAKALCPGVLATQANAAMPTKAKAKANLIDKPQNYNKSSALIKKDHPNCRIQRPKLDRYVQYECCEGTARS